MWACVALSGPRRTSRSLIWELVSSQHSTPWIAQTARRGSLSLPPRVPCPCPPVPSGAASRRLALQRAPQLTFPAPESRVTFEHCRNQIQSFRKKGRQYRLVKHRPCCQVATRRAVPTPPGRGRSCRTPPARRWRSSSPRPCSCSPLKAPSTASVRDPHHTCKQATFRTLTCTHARRGSACILCCF
jgi:hypothetical protein